MSSLKHSDTSSRHHLEESFPKTKVSGFTPRLPRWQVISERPLISMTGCQREQSFMAPRNQEDWETRFLEQTVAFE